MLPVIITHDMDIVRANVRKCVCIGCGVLLNEWQWCAGIYRGEHVGEVMCFECIEIANMDGS